MIRHPVYPPDLERLADYWTRYHVAKAVTAITVANLGTALHPAPALLAFFTAGAGFS